MKRKQECKTEESKRENRDPRNEEHEGNRNRKKTETSNNNMEKTVNIDIHKTWIMAVCTVIVDIKWH